MLLRTGFLLIAVLAGCGGAAIDAVVIDGAHSPPNGPQTPLAGVRGSLECPDLNTQLEPRETDASGHMKFIMERRYHEKCVLTVEKQGYPPAHVTLGDVCGAHEEEPTAPYCALETVVVIRLTP